MGIETKEKTIGDYTYRVSQLPASKARKLLIRLFRVAGPSLGKVLESLEGKDGTMQVAALKGDKGGIDVDLSKISDALALLATNVFEEDFEYVVATLLREDRVEYMPEGKWMPLNMQLADLHFAGKLDQLFKLIAFALEVNYAGFFAGTGGLVSVLKRAGEVVNPVPPQSSSPAS